VAERTSRLAVSSAKAACMLMLINLQGKRVGFMDDRSEDSVTLV
jgi:hypothetical protein